MHVDSKGPLDKLNGDDKGEGSARLLYPPRYPLEGATGDGDDVARGYRRMRRKRRVLRADAEGVHLLIIHG